MKTWCPLGETSSRPQNRRKPRFLAFGWSVMYYLFGYPDRQCWQCWPPTNPGYALAETDEKCLCPST
jgi:hypothetical protein